MKKLMLLTVFTVLGMSNVDAQGFGFGIKAGLNFASVDFDQNISDINGRTTFHVGAMVDLDISEKFSIQGEVLWSLQGYNVDALFFDDNENIENVEITTKLDYINVPILAKYEFTEGLSALVGPQIGFLIEANSEFNDIDIALSDGFNSTDISGAVGLMYEIDNGLNVGARYTFGLSDILDSDNADAKNYVVQLSVGYFF